MNRIPLCCIAALLTPLAAHATEPPRLAALQLDVEGARLATTVDDTTTDNLAGAFTLRSTFFLPHRLAPDPTPPALQPMLQRTTTFGLTAFAGHHTGSADRLSSPFAWREGTRAGGTLFADIYAAPWLALHAEAGASAGPDTVELLALSTVGARIWNVRLDAGASTSPLLREGRLTADVQPRFLFRAEAVLLQRINVRLALHTLEGGVAVRFDCDYYATPRLGLFIGASGAHGRIRPETALDEELLGFRVGFAVWPLERLGLTALWLPAWSTAGPAATVENRVRISLAARF